MSAVPLDVCRIVNRTVCLNNPDFLCLFLTSVVPFFVVLASAVILYPRSYVSYENMCKCCWFSLTTLSNSLEMALVFCFSSVWVKSVFWLLQQLVNSNLLLNLAKNGLFCFKVDRYGFLRQISFFHWPMFCRYIWPILKAELWTFLVCNPVRCF